MRLSREPLLAPFPPRGTRPALRPYKHRAFLLDGGGSEPSEKRVVASVSRAHYSATVDMSSPRRGQIWLKLQRLCGPNTVPPPQMERRRGAVVARLRN
ncbi:hypothetical protein MRX96_038617 [Rhipicephalus microplus]